MGIVAPDDIFRNRDNALIPQLRNSHKLYETTCIRKRQRLKKYFVNYGENRRGCSDSQGQRSDGRSSKPRIAGQSARRVTKITQQTGHT